LAAAVSDFFARALPTSLENPHGQVLAGIAPEALGQRLLAVLGGPESGGGPRSSIGPSV